MSKNRKHGMKGKMLLFINPIKEKSSDECIDELAVKLKEHITKAQRQYAEYNPFSFNKSKALWGVSCEKHFERGMTTMGVHMCSCGAVSSSYDVLLPGDYVTNTLGYHYLVHHRDEVPIDQIKTLKKIL